DRLARDGFGPERQRFTLAADMRYVGQAFELTVPWEDGGRTAEDGGRDGTIAGRLDSGIAGRGDEAPASEDGSESSSVVRPPSSVADNVGRLAARFHERYQVAYGHSDSRRTVELVNVRLTATGAIDRPALPPWSRDTATLEDALVTRRPVYFDGQAHDAPVYDRERFPAGTRFAGPAIVDEPGATTVVPPDWTARIDELGNMFLEQGAVSSQPSASNGANGANGHHG
ncbi:MAG: hypothetical protein HY329_19955, partial [Chloroflexi bacterium]|nr:hypothetical protein [Chloroflexota bacterium]